MEFESVIRGRRSIRRYKAEPVPQELIREILDEARWSPSWANTQVWNIYVLTGAALERLKVAYRQLAQSEVRGAPDFRSQGEWPAHLAARTKQLIDVRSAAAREDGPALAPAMAGMAELYGAPCLLLFAVEESLIADYACFDTGMIVQSLCLAAHDKGLGACIMARTVRHPDMLREVLPEAADKHFVIGVALGYPDMEAPINQFQRPRAPLKELVPSCISQNNGA
jgi:nitroreductase